MINQPMHVLPVPLICFVMIVILRVDLMNIVGNASLGII